MTVWGWRTERGVANGASLISAASGGHSDFTKAAYGRAEHPVYAWPGGAFGARGFACAEAGVREK
ncbi:hypothetical protein GCM10025795_37320 [Verticiella sediminum]